MRGACFSLVISAMICCQVKISELLYVSDPLISFTVRTNLFCSRITLCFGRKIGAWLNALCCCCSLFISIYRCVPPKGEVKNHEMRGMYFSPIITAMICCEVKISVLLYVSDPFIPFPIYMNLFCLCIRFVLWQKNQSLSQCIVLLL